MKKAVVLLSGGLDSATTLVIARREGFASYALSFAYGQRHSRELESAKKVAASLGVVEHLILALDLRLIGGSALTADIAVPKGRSPEEIGHGIPVTYVPARNTIFLAHALGWAEVLGAEDLFFGANVYDYSVSGDTRVWVRTANWARLMPIRTFIELPEDDYSTISLDPATLRLEWRRVTGRFRHDAREKRCFAIRLERGQEIVITEDHSLYTIDPATARLVTVKGSAITEGMPIVVPYDLSNAGAAWNRELKFLDLSGVPESCEGFYTRRSIVGENGHITNRLKRTRVPVRFPVTDKFLYILGLWLAEGGKEHDSRTKTLAFSIGGIPGAAELLQSYFQQFNVTVAKSPANDHDYHVPSSVFAAIFRFLGLFGTSKRGDKAFPAFFWELSQRQRRFVVAGLWDGDASHVFKREAVLSQKSHRLIEEVYHCFAVDGIFPIVKSGPNRQKLLIMRRSHDFNRFMDLYPLRHPSKRLAYEAQGMVKGRDQATGLWKCPGLWDAVASARLEPGEKTRIYNAGGKYDVSFRGQRLAFAAVPSLQNLVSSKLAFLRVREIRENREEWMYDLSVEGAENFVGNGILAHNSGYPDCRPEYIEAFERLANLATKAGVEGKSRFTIHTPLIRMTKAEIIKRGQALGVDFGLTWSCYEPAADGRACGLCDSCLLRKKGFAEAGLADPLPHAR